jgi:fumarylacetoacetate (FAA) hydrolase family protein
MTTAAMFPDDVEAATLVGRLLLDEGPTPVMIRRGMVEDVSRAAPTVADLMELDDPLSVEGVRLFRVSELSKLHPERLLAPVEQADEGADRAGGIVVLGLA